jgi:hypothetical protein
MDKIYDILLQMSLEYNGRQYTIEHIIGNTVYLAKGSSSHQNFASVLDS